MRTRPVVLLFTLAAISGLAGCAFKEDIANEASQRSVSFDIKVTRDGKEIPADNPEVTKSELVDAGEMLATMNTRLPFGLVGVEKGTGSLLIDNSAIYHNGKAYQTLFNSGLWEIPSTVLFSAYYPHVKSLCYGEQNTAYSIPFSVDETSAGPLVSKTVERAIGQLNILPLEFGHITNDIGFKICDVTPMPELQGLIHLRKLTAYNVASAGVYVNDLVLSKGSWDYQGYYRDVQVFDGDAVVGVGSENKKFVAQDALVDSIAKSHRYYAIPDDVVMGKQFVEVVFDVDGFTHNGLYYPPLTNQVAKYMLYGLLPDNVFVAGKQYTFHVGLDLSTIYQAITFDASIAGWESHIYENHEDF